MATYSVWSAAGRCCKACAWSGACSSAVSCCFLGSITLFDVVKVWSAFSRPPQSGSANGPLHCACALDPTPPPLGAPGRLVLLLGLSVLLFRVHGRGRCCCGTAACCAAAVGAGLLRQHTGGVQHSAALVWQRRWGLTHSWVRETRVWQGHH